MVIGGKHTADRGGTGLQSAETTDNDHHSTCTDYMILTQSYTGSFWQFLSSEAHLQRNRLSEPGRRDWVSCKQDHQVVCHQALSAVQKNFRLGEAPSLTAAITHNFTIVSSTPTTFQNNGSNWNDVTLPVK